MPGTSVYRRIHQLLLNPDTAVLATNSAGRYLIDRSVLVCVSGSAALPAIRGALCGLPDGVYQIRVTLPPRRRPDLQPDPDAIDGALGRLRRARHWWPVTATGWCWLNGDNQTAVRILARNDTSGPHHTAVNASLWHHWAAQLADLRCQMKAYQPEGKPATPCASTWHPNTPRPSPSATSCRPASTAMTGCPPNTSPSAPPVEPPALARRI